MTTVVPAAFDVRTQQVLDLRCVGTSANRPAANYTTTGLLRFETDTSAWVFYDGSNWVALPSISAAQIAAISSNTAALSSKNPNVFVRTAAASGGGALAWVDAVLANGQGEGGGGTILQYTPPDLSSLSTVNCTSVIASDSLSAAGSISTPRLVCQGTQSDGSVASCTVNKLEVVTTSTFLDTVTAGDIAASGAVTAASVTTTGSITVGTSLTTPQLSVATPLPHFKVMRNSALTLYNSGSAPWIGFNTVDLSSPSSQWNTNGYWTVPETGVYQINLSARFVHAGSNDLSKMVIALATVSVHSNGAINSQLDLLLRNEINPLNGARNEDFGVFDLATSCIESLVAGEHCAVWASATLTGGGQWRLGSDATPTTFLTAHKIGY